MAGVVVRWSGVVIGSESGQWRKDSEPHYAY